MAIVPANVSVGVANLYTAPSNTARPPDGMPYGGVWPAPWTAIGATDAGVTSSFDPKTQDIFIEEQPTPVQRLIDTAAMTVSCTLKEDLLANLLLAWGMGTVSTVAVNNGRTFADAVFNGTTTMTSATAAFVAGDVGRSVTDATVPATVPANTYIASVTNGTTVILSQAATLSNVSQSVTLGNIGPMSVYSGANTPNLYAVAFEALNTFGKARRLYLSSCTSASAKVDTAYRRAKEARMYAASFEYIGPFTGIDIRDVTG